MGDTSSFVFAIDVLRLMYIELAFCSMSLGCYKLLIVLDWPVQHFLTCYMTHFVMYITEMFIFNVFYCLCFMIWKCFI